MSTEVRNGNGRSTLSLTDARERTPAVNPIEAMRNSLQMALYNGIREADVGALATKLKTMAESGDLRAMQLYFKLIGALDRQLPPAAAVDPAAGQVAEVLHELLDEIRSARRPATAPQQLLGPVPEVVTRAKLLTTLASLASLGRKATYDLVRNTLAEDGMEITEADYKAARKQLWSARDDRED